jgi:hypothetical protein
MRTQGARGSSKAMTTLVRVVAAACSVCGAGAYRETVLALELSPLVVRPKVFVKGCSVIFNIHVNLVPVDGRERIAESYALGPHTCPVTCPVADGASRHRGAERQVRCAVL